VRVIACVRSVATARTEPFGQQTSHRLRGASSVGVAFFAYGIDDRPKAIDWQKGLLHRRISPLDEQNANPLTGYRTHHFSGANRGGPTPHRGSLALPAAKAFQVRASVPPLSCSRHKLARGFRISGNAAVAPFGYRNQRMFSGGRRKSLAKPMP